MTSFEKVVEILSVEADAIKRTVSVLDRASVESALETLSECKGKVILTGVGKSGVIAQKISQTMTSTGTVAVFVHPSDALHGSLGVISKEDVVIALSNSGETDEILAILPAIEKRGVKLIALVGNLDSTLASRADVVLDASVDKEACPLNLAPTTSTTVALSIGDAIAMALAESKGLTPQAFAENHPAGRLGRRLTIKVRDLMHSSPNIFESAGWLDVVKGISKHTLGAVNVVNDKGELVGIVTDGDLRRTIERTPVEEFSELNAASMMTVNPTVAEPEMLAFDALKLMEDRPRQISVLPVIEEKKCVGLLRLHDIVKSGL
ncbi:MAG: SIS domain-containing protein [Pyrinomonadaceae bacterium]